MASGNIKRRVSIRHFNPSKLSVAETASPDMSSLELIAVKASNQNTLHQNIPATLNGLPVVYDHQGFPILSEKLPEEPSEDLLEEKIGSGYFLQEELERDWERMDASHQEKRLCCKPSRKDRISSEIRNFYRLLNVSLSPSALKDEERFKRLLIKTRKTSPLLNQRKIALDVGRGESTPYVLSSSAGIAQLIFERQQEMEGEDEKIQNRFSMLVSNFLGQTPKIKNYINLLAESQAVYERHLQATYSALRTALESKIPLDANEPLAATLRSMPEYRKLKKVPGLNKKSIRETTLNIAMLINYATSECGGDSDGIKNTVYSLTWRVDGLIECLGKLRNQTQETNGQKPSQPFVNRPYYACTPHANAMQPSCQKTGKADAFPLSEHRILKLPYLIRV